MAKLTATLLSAQQQREKWGFASVARKISDDRAAQESRWLAYTSKGLTCRICEWAISACEDLSYVTGACSQFDVAKEAQCRSLQARVTWLGLLPHRQVYWIDSEPRPIEDVVSREEALTAFKSLVCTYK